MYFGIFSDAGATVSASKKGLKGVLHELDVCLDIRHGSLVITWFYGVMCC